MRRRSQSARDGTSGTRRRVACARHLSNEASTRPTQTHHVPSWTDAIDRSPRGARVLGRRAHQSDSRARRRVRDSPALLCSPTVGDMISRIAPRHLALHREFTQFSTSVTTMYPSSRRFSRVFESSCAPFLVARVFARPQADSPTRRCLAVPAPVTIGTSPSSRPRDDCTKLVRERARVATDPRSATSTNDDNNRNQSERDPRRLTAPHRRSRAQSTRSRRSNPSGSRPSASEGRIPCAW